MEENHLLVVGIESILGSRFNELYPVKNSIKTPKQIDFDISNPTQIKAILKSFEFATVVNFIQFEDVIVTEKQRGNKSGDAWKMNYEGTMNILEAIHPIKEKVHFIQLSTDRVFSGEKIDPGPYVENHKIEADFNKLSWFGYTMSEIEKEVMRKLGAYSTIVRVCDPSYLNNLWTNLGGTGPVQLPDNQSMSLSFTDEVCMMLETIIDKKLYGIFHSASTDSSTPYEIATYLKGNLGKSNVTIEPVTLEKYIKNKNESALVYPRYGGLNVNITKEKLGIKLSSWRKIVDVFLSQKLGA